MKSQTELIARLKYGVLGLVCGVVLAIIVGFGWGGWKTTLTSQKMSKEAVLANQAAICVAAFIKDPKHGENLKEFEKLDLKERVEFIEKGGWATMPGGEKADVFACRACVDGLALLIKK